MAGSFLGCDEDADRALSRGALTPQRLAAITRRRGGQHQTREHAVRRAEARRLALTISRIDQELTDNKCHLTDLVTHLAPQLLAKRGVGPVSAAQAIVSWSHPGRCRNDAAYAALAGASPIPASSGRIIRHRLNRGGDRHLNRTLHDILLTRWRTCQRARAYIARRRAQGKTAAVSAFLPRYRCRPPCGRVAGPIADTAGAAP
jgi:transposase